MNRPFRRGRDWLRRALVVEGESGRRVLLRRSPLARKIILFNLVAMVVMAAGVLLFNPFRDSLVYQRETAIVRELDLIAQLIGARPAALTEGGQAFDGLRLPDGATVYLFSAGGGLIGSATTAESAGPDVPLQTRSTLITDLLGQLWEAVSRLGPQMPVSRLDPGGMAQALARQTGSGPVRMASVRDAAGATIFVVAQGVAQDGRPIGTLAMTTAAGEIDRLVRVEREQILQVFLIAVVVSVGLSLVLASTIANPIADLARAAEAGQDRDAGHMVPARVRIPDLTGRPDEIGRLSGAMRGMVDALYQRIDANEQFAADVAHEIKNPLASLRSAVASLQVVKRNDQRQKLLEIIDADVGRLDRLVSDISNASRLDSELVREEQERFDMVPMLRNLGEYLGEKAAGAGVGFEMDLPAAPVTITGLESRLAQVFVNLITNAVSFSGPGDRVRLALNRTPGRIVVTVEDTGPGIPEEALTRVFERFYSQRPARQFGGHSGLGLAISRQIVEAHGGTIRASNIGPEGPHRGARFAVELPA
ncbi:sensor histidine kinase [Paenirhodobacter enshiensis]|uniref:sensor histidine kinase n=1 Tax=Paenirhodobacter enshiensis TaxID=1105367 RepID=UPI00068E2A5D|nr:sensor histidine kinase [Paenirhodobacter enshiensis]